MNQVELGSSYYDWYIEWQGYLEAVREWYQKNPYWFDCHLGHC